ncbi:unnamed protein product [Larinioides sclopetarius]|uniref:Uncharacterized protein n=1 Tax=Larinioides sclopetarius TaxID=280406 RepID=A0AAV2BPK9_9ARAC
MILWTSVVVGKTFNLFRANPVSFNFADWLAATLIEFISICCIVYDSPSDGLLKVAAADLNRLGKIFSRRYGRCIREIHENPEQGEVLHGSLREYRKFRVNHDHRIRYWFDDDVVIVVACGPHKKVYG